jgi:hypothetical protein
MKINRVPHLLPVYSFVARVILLILQKHKWRFLRRGLSLAIMLYSDDDFASSVPFAIVLECFSDLI